jgi:hypothetical protein
MPQASPKNPYEKKSAAAFHTFLEKTSAKAKISTLRALNATVQNVH